MYKYLSLYLFSCLIGSSLYSQNPARTGKDFAYFFYVDNFQDKGWPSLPYTKGEVNALTSELKDSYGFAVEIISNPTKLEIENKIAQLNSHSYGPADQVFFFFSSHGHFFESDDRGYLIPTDGKVPAKDPLSRSWISYDDLGSYITRIKCQHILVGLDACHSGAFGSQWKKYPGDIPPKDDADCRAKETNALYHDSRLYFTSGAKDQKSPAKSSFARRWLKALQDGRYKKVINTLELRYYLGSVTNPEPEGGSFTNLHQGGDFVFIHKTACGFPDFIDKTADRKAWRQAKNSNNLASYRQYSSNFPKGEFRPLADRRIAELEAIQKEEQDWEAAKKSNSISAYTDFVQKHPLSIYRDMAEYNRSQLESEKEPYRPAKTVADDLPNMVFVQGGTFQMGSKDGDSTEMPVHSVKVGDFYIHRYETTLEEFNYFIVATGYKTDADKGGGSNIRTSSKWEKKAGVNWKYDALGKLRPSTEDKHPVIHVSWNDAVAYCNWRSERDGLQQVYTISKDKVSADWDATGYRLPTEAEWEFAARSRGKDEMWAGTSKDSELDSFANWKVSEDGHQYTAPVGSFNDNALGLKDMSGNVYEWCWDYWHGTYPSSPQINPRGPDSGSYRVFRGGSWINTRAFLRCAFRGKDSLGFRNGLIGFRLARAAP